MSVENYPLKDFHYPCKYELNKENPYLQPEMPQEAFDKLYDNLKKMAVAHLSKYDPEHASIYQQAYLDSDKLFDPQYKIILRDFFAGLFNPEAPIFKQTVRNIVGKLCSAMRFYEERKMYKDELDKIEIKNPMFIVSLPRSGSTYLHNLLSTDPRASGIRFWEHLFPGSKTMKREARRQMITDILNQVHEESKELNKVHNLDSVDHLEEEAFFMEMIGQCFIMTGALPRLEQYRVHLYELDFHYVYEALMDELKMHLVEFPLKGDDCYLCLKGVNHFATMAPMLDVCGRKEYNARFIWIHREPIEQIKSMVILMNVAKGRFEHDLGKDDMVWLNENVIKVNEIILRNSIAARDEYIRQDPTRAKQFFDVGFTEAVTKPKETVKKIYDYFGIEITPEAEKQLELTIKEGDPQRKHGRKPHDESLYHFDEDKIREQYKFYYERFGQYMPNFYGKK
ncbi:sulfotransferase, putative [Entamoeba histolytica HM-1:IMSS-B]|uniref:Sulfotransferase n=6 Tax=Entamoeba histolytica TaxID=5759 RepID=C4MBA2_ENTH1|nr:hypothetical protein EHI_031640 [Entamoeba histolytica HM-1:IMSS]EMD44901.1 sulfotransferase, putative [Entamoeba histolytica KU27]EMH74066.1 sulfotransferase, putative [Entamoeba histolytica HM-1:IMSS-B]EMS17777.1 sulfotransferase, putative [Entamoeba histolytica HM-3:IMSS]ENY60344.1 sulfotransferase, putative [Entamoeba histolytica HM-1:IMSS-A]GAT99225.1 hypothetical protein CL6EHI_031640 [Entamoeba histolytica]|eukprot:XP_653539.2 hypothetical protein EHI_031640 [Entamoeba histolytica HM-1:IMSS]